jgi:hypothetical protein
MIPPPPLTEDGELALNEWGVKATLVGGILARCCVCPHSSVTHWGYEGRYVPLHERCASHLVAEWRELIANDQTSVAVPVGRPLGAYARRMAAQAGRGADASTVYRVTSVSLGSPYFRPGMPEGAPWVAVANMSGDVPLISPAGANGEAHVRRVNELWRASAVRGFMLTFGGRLPLGGYVMDPTGARSDEWRIDELSSRVDSAKLAV